MNQILAVTGATGKSGSFFVSMLNEHHENINANFPDGVRFLIRNQIKSDVFHNLLFKYSIDIGDLSDMSFIERSLINVDTVFHIAGIRTSLNVVKAAIINKVRRIILVHTTGIYSKYKSAGEGYREIDKQIYDLCNEAKIILTILRPTMIYGTLSDNNVAKFIKMVDKLPVMPIVNRAEYDLQPVHYKDLGMAYYSVLINEASTANCDFDLSGGCPISLKVMLDEIAKNLDKKPHFLNIPFTLAYTGALVVYILTFSKKDYREKVQRLCEPRVYSHSDASTSFGYSPMSFEDGIVDEVKEYLAGRRKDKQ